MIRISYRAIFWSVDLNESMFLLFTSLIQLRVIIGQLERTIMGIFNIYMYVNVLVLAYITATPQHYLLPIFSMVQYINKVMLHHNIEATT